MNADATHHSDGACDHDASPNHHVPAVTIVLAVAIVLMVIMLSTDVDAESETFNVDGLDYEVYMSSMVRIIGADEEISNLTIFHSNARRWNFPTLKIKSSYQKITAFLFAFSRQSFEKLGIDIISLIIYNVIRYYLISIDFVYFYRR